MSCEAGLPNEAGAGSDPRAAGGRSRVVPLRQGGGRRRRVSLGTGLLGVLTALYIGGASASIRATKLDELGRKAAVEKNEPPDRRARAIPCSCGPKI
jgi:hypothetical protein